jgi:gliding motility-associated-like protein
LGNKVLPLLTLGNDTFFCEGDSVLLNVYDTGCTYLWNNASHDSAIYVSKADTVVVWKTYHGCVKTDSVILIAVPFPSIDIMKDTVFCDHGTIKLISMTNTMQLLWNNGTTDPELPVQQSGTYWCRASTGTCMVADTIHVVVHPYPKLELGMDTILCSGQSLLLDASDSNCVYSWSTGESTSVIQVSTSGMIKEISARDMCQTIDSVNVDFMDPPVLIPLHDTSFCDGNTYILNAHSKNGNLIWNNFSTDTFIAVKTSGNYSVTSSNRCGNSQSTADITFYTCLCNVFIPDIFTPDDDHLNDQFQPVMNCHAISYELQLFNRWGQQLFQTNLPQLGWDGTFQNRPCPTGVYFWVLTTITENQVGSRNIFSHSGTVSLLR